ncbi:MAG TPA: MAPEG family protein [Candidatus Caenarcaniphilales bacterium]
MIVSPAQNLLYGIAAAAALIYLPHCVVAYGRLQQGYDMHAPRAMFDKLPAYAQRATWAYQNSFEVFVLFVAAALMVYASGNTSGLTTSFVVAFLVLRLAYCVFYITDVPLLRSLMWAGSMVCVAGLMTLSLGISSF